MGKGKRIHYSPRQTRIVPALLCSLAAQGDDCVIDRLGRYVPEQEQRAFIEWQDGHQRLYVATRTAATDRLSLRLAPVRARPRPAPGGYSRRR